VTEFPHPRDQGLAVDQVDHQIAQGLDRVGGTLRGELRALETAHPRPRLFEDPYAARFLGLRVPALLAAVVPPVGRAIERSIDRKYPAGQRGNAVVARVNRHVPRGHREHVRFVPVDLQRDDLDAALGAAGFRPARTAVIWEGVTNYLDAESVDATIRWMAGCTTAGSRLIFTYLDAVGLHAPAAGADAVADSFRDVGEPMTYGLDPQELAGYLADRGLTLIEDWTASLAAERYLRPLGRHDRTGEFSHIAVTARP